MRISVLKYSLTGLLLGTMALSTAAETAYGFPADNCPAAYAVAYGEQQNNGTLEEDIHNVKVLHYAWNLLMIDTNLRLAVTYMENDPDKLIKFCDETAVRFPNLPSTSKNILDNAKKRAESMNGMNIDQASYERKCQNMLQSCREHLQKQYKEYVNRIQPALLNIARQDPDKALQLCNEFRVSARRLSHLPVQEQTAIETMYNNTISQIMMIKRQKSQ